MFDYIGFGRRRAGLSLPDQLKVRVALPAWSGNIRHKPREAHATAPSIEEFRDLLRHGPDPIDRMNMALPKRTVQDMTTRARLRKAVQDAQTRAR